MRQGYFEKFVYNHLRKSVPSLSVMLTTNSVSKAPIGSICFLSGYIDTDRWSSNANIQVESYDKTINNARAANDALVNACKNMANEFDFITSVTVIATDSGYTEDNPRTWSYKATVQFSYRNYGSIDEEA